MKKNLCVLVGSLALLSLASCGDKQNKVIATMVDGKSSEEVVEMITAKYSDQEFLASYGKNDIKADLDLDFSMKADGEEVSESLDMNFVADMDKGGYLDLSIKSNISGSKTTTDYELEYDLESDSLYMKYEDSETNALEKIYYEGIFGSLDSTDPDAPSTGEDETPSTDEIIALIEQYKDSITFEVSEDLELVFTANDAVNKVVENYIGSIFQLSSLLTYSDTSCTFVVQFDENLYFSGVELEIDTTLSLMGESIKLSISADFDIDYGNFSYSGLKNKDSYEKQNDMPNFPGLI